MLYLLLLSLHQFVAMLLLVLQQLQPAAEQLRLLLLHCLPVCHMRSKCFPLCHQAVQQQQQQQRQQ
jgi:hypothetical protein